jgi:hypothetical protein
MSSTTAATFSTWNLDAAHSTVEYKVRHMMISSSKGKFSGLSGVLKLDEADYSRSTVEASIPVASLSTGDDSRDDHIRNQDFLDADKVPAMTFKSTGIKSKGDRNYAVTGDLTGCVRRGARDTDRQVRQMGDRQHQAPCQHQSAAGCRSRCRLGCAHCFAWPACCSEGNQRADGGRLSQAGRR